VLTRDVIKTRESETKTRPRPDRPRPRPTPETELGFDDRAENCLNVVHAVGAQDSEGIQSLRDRTDNSVNMISDRETVRKVTPRILM